MKRKPPGSVEKDLSILTKDLKLGPSPVSFARKPERASLPVVDAPMVTSSPPPSKSVAEVESPLGGATEQPLAVMPITVWNPPSEGVKSPPRREEKLKRKNL